MENDKIMSLGGEGRNVMKQAVMRDNCIHVTLLSD